MFRLPPKLSLDMLISIMLIKKQSNAHLPVLFVEQFEIENLVFHEFIYRNFPSLTR